MEIPKRSLYLFMRAQPSRDKNFPCSFFSCRL